MVSSHTENTKRIAKNTLMLYVRMLFGMLVSLYTSRVILEALGVEDYGIYNVVGGFVTMFSLLTGALSHSTGRFLTFELGKNNMDGLRKYFSTSLLIHIVLACIILIVAETIGLWFLNAKMTIPSNRIYAANWVYHCSVISFMISLIGIPYNASIVSHEHMNMYAYIGIFDIILRLLIVLLMAYLPYTFDRLIVYAVLLVLAFLFVQSVYALYCCRNFKECRTHPVLYKSCWKKMWNFTGWNFIGGTALVLKDQGVNILLNLFYGPILNTVRGLSITVSNAVNSFAGNFMAAINPQIIKSYASNDYEYMFQLMEKGTRFSFYIIWILTLPILLETDFILTLWLKNVPDHTVNFVRLILVVSLIDVLSNTIITAQTATGKIRNYQLVVGGMLLTNFPISYALLKLGFQPECIMFVAIFVSICCLFLRLLILRNSINLSIIWFCRRICKNVFFVVLVSIIIPSLIYYFMPKEGWMRFVIVCTFCLLCTLLSILRIGCSPVERQFIYDKVYNIYLKLKKR